MKLPVSKEEDGRRMMMMSSGTSRGRKGLIRECRETSLVGGRAILGVPFKSNMDLGSGDTLDYYNDLPNNYDSFGRENRFDALDFHPMTTATAVHVPDSTSIPPPSPTHPPPSTPLWGKAHSSSSDSISKRDSNEQLNDDNRENLFKGKVAEAKNSTLAVVEDGKQPNFTANESNPTVPAPTESSKTSTLRLSDRTRSESEDDIEKMDEPEQDGTLIGHKTLYKTTATTDNSPNSEKIDKNGNRSDLDQNEADDDCVVQCLYYTIQCCECVIF